MLACGSVAPGQTAEAVRVVVDATVAGAPLNRLWPFYGYDEINYTTTPEGRALLGTLAASNTAPVHVRSHFLLNSGDGVAALKWGSTNVYSEDAAGRPIYDWTLTDGIFDALAASGTLPFVELGFMPEALSTHPTPYRNSTSALLDGGCFYPPTDYQKWGSLIGAWAAHAAERYPNAAGSWLWELWNEPDIDYWQGTFDEYAQLYDRTEAALHEVMPQAALGGPAVALPGGPFMKQFLRHCATGTNAVTGAIGTRLDHVTFHAKGGVIVDGAHVKMDLGNQLRIHRLGFKAVAAFPEFQTTPIYITEADPDGCAACPVADYPANAYRTSPAYGAYELAMMKHTEELALETKVNLRGLLTWAFTFPGMPYFAGYRELSSHGVGLPVLGAFQLLGRLAGDRLPLTSTGSRALDDILVDSVGGDPDIDGLATRNGSTVQILVWNYHDELVPSPAARVRLSVKLPETFGTAGSKARISHLRVDESHGDAYELWLGQGRPSAPSVTQLAALQQASVPSLLSPEGVTTLEDGAVVNLDFPLPRFGVSLVTLEPFAGR